MTAPFLALDIESIPTVDNPSFEAPSDWLVFAVALAYRDEDESVVSSVFFRETDSPTAGQLLLEDVFAWMKTEATAGDTLLTYNGSSFDLPIIREQTHTCDVIEGPPGVPSLTTQWETLLDLLSRRDLFLEVRDQQSEHAKWPSLVEACEERGIRTTSPRFDGRVIEGADMPMLGEQILDDTGDPTAARETVRKYATQDVELLFPLADTLDKQEVTM